MGPIDPWSMNVWNWNPEAQKTCLFSCLYSLGHSHFHSSLSSSISGSGDLLLRNAIFSSGLYFSGHILLLVNKRLFSYFSVLYFSLSLPFSFSLIQFCPFCSHLSVLCFYSALFISSIFPSNYFFKSCFLLICCFLSFTYRLVHLLSRFVTSYVKFNKRIHNIGIITWR